METIFMQSNTTRTEYCSNRLFIVFGHHTDNNISTNVSGERQDALEWTQDIFHTPDFIKFDVTYKCLGVGDLSAHIFNQEHHTELLNPECCYEWM